MPVHYAEGTVAKILSCTCPEQQDVTHSVLFLLCGRDVGSN